MFYIMKLAGIRDVDFKEDTIVFSIKKLTVFSIIDTIFTMAVGVIVALLVF